MTKLQECGAEVARAANVALSKYDVRLVLASLGVSFAETFSAALAAGVDRRYVLEVLVGVIDCAFTAPAKPPAVTYIDGDEVLGRKQ
jgi:hypothetical protein